MRGKIAALDDAEDPKGRRYNEEDIQEFASNDGIVTFGLLKFEQDVFPDVVWNIIFEFTTFDPTIWTNRDCDTYFRHKLELDVHFNMISGADLESMSFSKMESLYITDRTTQNSLASTIRRHLIGPSYYPWSWSRPRPGGNTEFFKGFFKGALYKLLYVIAFLIAGPLVFGLAIVLSPLIATYCACYVNRWSDLSYKYSFAVLFFYVYYACFVAALWTGEPWLWAIVMIAVGPLCVAICTGAGIVLGVCSFRETFENLFDDRGSTLGAIIGNSLSWVFAVTFFGLSRDEEKWNDMGFSNYSDWTSPMLCLSVLEIVFSSIVTIYILATLCGFVMQEAKMRKLV